METQFFRCHRLYRLVKFHIVSHQRYKLKVVSWQIASYMFGLQALITSWINRKYSVESSFYRARRPQNTGAYKDPVKIWHAKLSAEWNNCGRIAWTTFAATVLSFVFENKTSKTILLYWIHFLPKQISILSNWLWHSNFENYKRLKNSILNHHMAQLMMRKKKLELTWRR